MEVENLHLKNESKYQGRKWKECLSYLELAAPDNFFVGSFCSLQWEGRWGVAGFSLDADTW
jgi:hypothetical protein